MQAQTNKHTHTHTHTKHIYINKLFTTFGLQDGLF